MPGLLNMSSVMMCPHGGQVSVVTQNTRVQAGGAFAIGANDTYLIAGCPFVLGLIPSPCVMVQWVSPSVTTQVMGDFVLTEESVGLCIAATGAPQGTVLIVETQPQVSGT
jgi:hypothetical protein